MTETEFMRVVSTVRNIEDPAFIDLSLEKSPFDSLDLLALRSALETELGCNLTDEKFVPTTTLRDLFHLVSQ